MFKKFVINFRSQIGHCQSRDSIKKQQNLHKAMEEARKRAVRSLDLTGSESLVLPKYTDLETVQLISEGSTAKSSKGGRSSKMQLDLINLESTCNSPMFSS